VNFEHNTILIFKRPSTRAIGGISVNFLLLGVLICVPPTLPLENCFRQKQNFFRNTEVSFFRGRWAWE